MSRIIGYLLLGVLICCVLVECKKKDDDDEEGGGGGGKCLKPDPVPVDEKMGIEQAIKKDAYLVMMKKRSFGPESFTKEPKKDKRKWKHAFCFEGTANTELGDFKVKGKCQYNKANEMYCEAGTASDGLGVGDLKGVADVWVALTDNKTFALAVACLNGDTPVWAVASTKKEISKDEEKKVLERIVELGFKEDEVEPKESFKGTKIKKADCSKMEDGDKDGGLMKAGKGKKGADLGDLGGGIGR